MEEDARNPNKNFTFDNVRVRDISRENEVLLQKLQRIAVKGSGATSGKVPSESKRRESSQEINRRRKEQEIARQNLMIANRLLNTKSAAFDRKKMKDEQELQEKYLRNASAYPPPGSAGQIAVPKIRSRSVPQTRPPWFKELPKEDLAPIGRPEWKD